MAAVDGLSETSRRAKTVPLGVKAEERGAEMWVSLRTVKDVSCPLTVRDQLEAAVKRGRGKVRETS